MKCCTAVQHFITQSKSLLVGQSELLHSNVEQLLTNITAVLSKKMTKGKRESGVPVLPPRSGVTDSQQEH